MQNSQYPKQVDWDNYQFRCSMLGKLFTSGRAKGALMGDTCKTALREIWLAETYDFRKEITSKYLSKGNQNEQDAIDMLIEQVYPGKLIPKNKKNFQNGILTGTPDIIISLNDGNGIVHDTKCSWDIMTFANAGIKKDYELQLQGYMYLLDFDQAELDYVLTNTPNEMISDEKRRLEWKYIDAENDPEFIRKCEQIDLNNNFDRVPIENRIKPFKIEKRESFRTDLEERVPLWRKFLKEMTL